MTGWLRTAGRRVAGSTFGDAVIVAHRARVTGLAAEAAFWGVFALPWLTLGLVAGMAQLEQALGGDAVSQFREQVLEIADDVLTARAIDELLEPLLDSILVQGRAAIGLVGIVISIWAGSRVIHALVDGMTIVYRQEGLRSYVATRLVSVAVYVGGLVSLIVAAPVVVAGPTFAAGLTGVEGQLMQMLVAVAQAMVGLAGVVSLYHWSVQHRTRWVADIPGALVALGLWAGFSYALSWYFRWLLREGSIYGVISAPIAVMYWAYVTCLALLLGAAFNGALAVRRGWYRTSGPTVGGHDPGDGDAQAPQTS